MNSPDWQNFIHAVHITERRLENPQTHLKTMIRDFVGLSGLYVFLIDESTDWTIWYHSTQWYGIVLTARDLRTSKISGCLADHWSLWNPTNALLWHMYSPPSDNWTLGITYNLLRPMTFPSGRSHRYLTWIGLTALGKSTEQFSTTRRPSNTVQRRT